MDIRPIRNDDDHATAVAEIRRLWDATEGSPDSDKLDVLATLVDAYEAKRWPVPTSSRLEILHDAIGDMGHTQAELAGLLGSRSRASEVLCGKRPLSLDMIRTISAAWHIPAKLLIGTTTIEAA